MIRFIGIVLFLGFFFLFGLILLGIEWLLGKVNKKKADWQSLRIVQWALRQMIAISGSEIVYIGEENIPEEAALFVANHRSMFDIVITYPKAKTLLGFVAKKNLLKAPVLRVWMKRVYCLFLDREDPREGMKTIKTATEQIKNGISIFIFPEGTRNKGEELSLLPFHAGSFKIAERGGCPVVPVSINNSQAVFEAQFPRIRKRKVIVEYGKPIYMNELSREERKQVPAMCETIIMETIRKNSSLVDESHAM